MVLSFALDSYCFGIDFIAFVNRVIISLTMVSSSLSKIIIRNWVTVTILSSHNMIHLCFFLKHLSPKLSLTTVFSTSLQCSQFVNLVITSSSISSVMTYLKNFTYIIDFRLHLRSVQKYISLQSVVKECLRKATKN